MLAKTILHKIYYNWFKYKTSELDANGHYYLIYAIFKTFSK